jgi:hypothetical protein
MHTHAAKPEVQLGPASALLQRKCACGGAAGVMDECAECSGMRLQRKAEGTQAPAVVPAIVHTELRRSGLPLDAATRSLMEPGFRHDFSRVRVHADTAAAQSAKAINALAYTVGHDVVFAAHQYSPTTAAGRRLLAHELAHVVQQERVSAANATARAGLSWEREADAAADAVLAGRDASIAGRSDRPLLSLFSETKNMTEPSGAEVKVDRIITPGKCISKPEGRSSSSADATGQQAFLELDYCKGRTGVNARAEANYGDALDKAKTAAADLAKNLATQQPAQALQTFQNDLNQVAPNAKVELSFQAPGVRLGTTGTGSVSGAQGATGTGTITGAVDFKSITFRVEYQVQAGTRQDTSQQVVISVGTRDRSKQDRNCFVCACSDPQIVFQCRRIEPPGKPQPPPAPLEPVIVPLFFEFEKTEPRADWKEGYEEALKLAVEKIRDGYTITRIEGNTSPEGPELPKKKGGFNNTDLAQQRATEANNDLREKIRIAHAGFGFRGLKSLGDALLSAYPVEGSGELFGKEDGKEVSEDAMFRHLTNELKAPATGEPDKLGAANVTGEGLPKDIEAKVEAEVEEFRTGKRGKEKLTKAQRLEAIYRPLRRALIFLSPPPPPKLPILVGKPISPDVAEAALGKEIDCTEAHLKLFADSLPPKSEMFQGECAEGGEQTIDPGQSKP